jgi:hypothetical protein
MSSVRECWSVGSMAKGTHRLTRTSSSTVLVEALGTTLLEGPFELLYRSPDEPVRVGDRLEDSHIRVLAWQGGHLRPVENLRIGHSLDIDWSPGPVGML